MATITKRSWVHKGEPATAYRVAYTDSRGRRRFKQFKKRIDATNFASTCEGSIALGLTPTIKETSEMWIRACERGLGEHDKVEATTVCQYKGNIKHHVISYFGEDLRIGEITSKRVKEFRDHLLTKSISRTRAKSVFVSFAAMLKEAVYNEHLVFNPATGVSIKMSSRDHHHPDMPSKAEIVRILEKLDGLVASKNQWVAKTWRRYRAMIMTCIFTGLRASEIRGLTWPNVDLKADTIEVTQRADRYHKIGRPKSKAGNRKISIPKNLVIILREWMIECPPGRLKLVFPNWQGNVESISNIRKRCWLPLLERAEIVHEGQAKYTPHSLRHFRASILIDSGATAKEVMEEMGHSSITMTFNTYGHLFPDGKDQRKRRAEAIATDLGVGKR